MPNKENTFCAIALFLLAIIANVFPLPFFTGSALFFGNVFAVVATILLGIRHGVVISVLASVVLYIHWQHLFALVPMLIEVCVVAWALAKRRNVIIFATLYWLTLGALIVAAEYFLLTTYLVQTKWAIVIKFIINGVINVAIGYLLAAVYLYLRKRPPIEQLCMRKFMTLIVFYAVSATAIVSAYYSLKYIQSNKLSQLKSQLKLHAQHVSSEVESYISNTQNRLILLADLHNNAITPDNFTQQFAQIARHDAGILTMLKADKNGLITHTYPTNLFEKINESGEFLSVDTRFYFKEAKKTHEPVVSDVFQGRGFGKDPLIALSAPLFDKNRFDGIIEASLDLKNFRELDKKLIADEQSLLIIDNTNRVIYHSAETEYQFLQNLESSPLFNYLNQNKQYFYISNQGNYFIAQQSTLNELGWRAITLMPRALYEQEIVNIALRSLFIYLLFILVFVLVISKLAESISRPISSLADKLDKLKTTSDFAQFKLHAKPSIILEIAQLMPVINNFSNELRRSLNSLQQALQDADNANQKLAQMNQELGQLINDKTLALQLALREANKASEAKSTFLANMSHEVRTPLNGILGTIQLLLDTTQDAQSKHFLNQALISSNALLTILNDILDVSKIEEGKLSLEQQPFDLNMLLESIYYSLLPEAQDKGIDLLVERGPQFHGEWIGDAVRTRQILQNIAANAVKFTEHGEVTLTIDVNNEDQLTILIQDTGIGMDENALDRLFNRFEQADKSTTRKYGGSGLGMAISASLVELMGGSIEVDSTPNEGSQFKITLPLNKSNKRQLFEAHDDVALPDFNEKHILFAEDNKINQMVISAMLTKTQCELTIVENGLEAVRKTQEQQFDLVLLDIQMPEMDGVEACQIIREKNAHLPIIALTANAMKNDVATYLAGGFNDHVIKPVKANTLYRACIKYLS